MNESNNQNGTRQRPEFEHRKQCANAKARGVAPTFEKLEKWLRGIGSLIDGRIVIAEKVLEFVNKDYG